MFFCIHEFTNKTIRGYFIIFVMTSYGMFLTFGVVFDGMQDEATKARRDGMYGLDFIFRVSMHVATAALFLSVFFDDLTCTSELFPDSFTFAAVYVLANAAYVGFLYYKYKYTPDDFLFDAENLPEKSFNNLRYNTELFD